MKRPGRRRPRALESLSPADEARVEALTVAMALAPGVYARNRMYDLFANAGVQRAKSRAATLRGIVKHLGRASELRLDRANPHARPGGFVVRYEIPALCLSRVVELTRVELATLRILAARAGATCLAPEADDRALVETSLARLLLAGGDTGNLARAAQDATTPSSPPPAQ
jgi:hypothetical protein